MKNFYDIWLLARLFDFDEDSLTEAIRQTFKRRGTPIPLEIEAFSTSFIDAKQIQWTAFWKRLEQEYVLKNFKDIILAVEEFLSPAIYSLFSKNSNPLKWKAPGP